MLKPSATWQKKYRWVVTWPGEGHEDWSAFHDGLYIGRIFRDNTSLKKGSFEWHGGCSSWHGFCRPMPQGGRAAEAWEAAKAIEDWYDAGLARSGPRPAKVEAQIQALAHLNPPGWRD